MIQMGNSQVLTGACGAHSRSFRERNGMRDLVRKKGCKKKWLFLPLLFLVPFLPFFSITRMYRVWSSVSLELNRV